MTCTKSQKRYCTKLGTSYLDVLFAKQMIYTFVKLRQNQMIPLTQQKV